MDKSKIDDILLPVPLEEQERRENKVKSEFWPKMRSFAAQIPFAEDAAAAWYCATDKNTPLKVRGTLFAALAYFIMPIDVVPDILAFIGFTDDTAVLMAALALVSQNITEEHREKAREALSQKTEV
ncbi:YkvA family protein [Pseudahrensia aquimaris]|uniref:YkvA family protein n=1 Tax=Pseudahrensia aquimaris TaxID=744461 RepID=A0ABW3FI64_9HYPH